MKIIVWSAIVCCLLACGSKPEPNETLPGSEVPDEKKTSATDNKEVVADLPAGAIREKFTDSEGMEKVTLKDGAGQLIAQGTLVNGKREGSWTELNSNGTIKSVTPYVNGLKEGWYVELNTNGQFTRRILYHNNVKHGEYKEYNYSTLKEERFYQNDKLEGTVKIYYDNGKMMEEGNYKNGTRDGLSRWYDQEGKMTIEYEYRNGELVKK